MRPRAIIRPTARAWGIGVAAGALGVAGAAAGHHLLVWVAVALASFIVLSGALSLGQYFRDRRLALPRATSPAQLQVGRAARTVVRWPGGRPARPLGVIVDAVPGALPGPSGSWDLTPSRRGEVTWGPVLLHRSDPFNLFLWRSVVRRRERVLVWPRTDGVPEEVFHRLIRLTTGQAGAPAPQVDDLALREYRHGDPLSRVYWKRPRPDGGLLVRHDEPSSNPEIDLVLITGPPEETDRGVDILAAAASALRSAEHSLRLLTPGSETTGSAGEMLTALALAGAGEACPDAGLRGDVVIVALAPGNGQAAQWLVSRVAASGVDPESVFVFPSGDLDPASRRLLTPFTVVAP